MVVAPIMTGVGSHLKDRRAILFPAEAGTPTEKPTEVGTPTDNKHYRVEL